MIVEYARYRVTDDGSALKAAYAKASESLRACPECLGYELSRCHEEPDRFILRLAWVSLEGHLEGFRKGPHFAAFLAQVRPFIAQIEEMQHYVPTPVRDSGAIYAALGGAETFFRLARRMHARMKEHALLGPRFAHAAESHVPHLGIWLCEVFGGPKLYSACLDEIAPMLRRHAKVAITEAERARFIEVTAAALRDVAPAGSDPAALSAVDDYIVWGTDVAVANAMPDHVADPGAGVPRWELPDG